MRHPLMRRFVVPLAAVSVALVGPAQAAAGQSSDSTRVVVRVLAHDAKLLHDGVDGARVTIRDAATGRVLATGVQRGGSGDTERIMHAPRGRRDTVLGTPGAAEFSAALAIEQPTMVRIEVEGPLAAPAERRAQASKTMLVLPGRDVEGEGVVLELNGLFVEIMTLEQDGAAVDVAARVRMACGCPITPGGVWDAGYFDVTARVMRGGQVLAEEVLAHAGAPSMFAGRLVARLEQGDRIEVIAAQRNAPNFGMDVRDRP